MLVPRSLFLPGKAQSLLFSIPVFHIPYLPRCLRHYHQALAMAASALPTTLRSVTATKIVELKKQRDAFETSKAEINNKVKRTGDHLDKTQVLLDGCCGIEGVRIPDESSSEDERSYSRSSKAQKLNNSRRLLRQAKVDPSFPASAVDKIQVDLAKDLELKSLQHQHAQFYSELVTEWISDAQEPADSSISNDDPSMSNSSFENVGRKEMHEQRAEWEAIVFSRAVVDTSAVTAYLEKLFTSQKEVKKAYNDMKRSIGQFCHSLKSREVFDLDSVKIGIKGLLATDLLSEEKRAILKTFSTNKEVLKEVADVLQMRFESLDTWKWTTTKSAISLEQRRQLNGKYRVFMDEDVLDALLVHQLGMEWASQLKAQFMTFFNSFAWKRTGNMVPTEDRQRREWFLGADEGSSANLPTRRRDAYSTDYFMTQLPENVAEGARGYGDSDDDISASTRQNPLEVKHGLLHLLITEALVSRHLHPDRRHTVFRSDYRWFGPSLPHSTIFTILKFFGVDDFWLEFIRKFLEAPLRFMQDGENGQIQVRSRGVPMSHALSDVLSESVLFVGDFAINHATESNLYRLHDDFWFWGPFELCKRAWHQMRVFASVMGIEFNEEKTGSVTFEPLSSDNSDDDLSVDYEGLPAGDVRWGFLRLTANTARFEIDQAMVDDHIKELQLQLASCNSIFSYVQAYNSYAARFFSNNFGKASFGFGRDHLDMMVQTFGRIQKAMFKDGRVTDHLTKMATERFNVKSVPEGFWYLPISMGGVELRNPVVPLLAMRESVRRSPERILEKALEQDEAKYLIDKENYERRNTGSGLGRYNIEVQAKIRDIGDEFMSRDEYFKYREERSHNLAAAYDQLLSVPAEKPIDSTSEIESLLHTLKSVRNRKASIQKNFNSMDSYWKWIVAVFGPEIVEKYGSLQMVDPGQVPLGVVSVMKAGKIRWKG